jgi:hypothetical protein
VPDNQWWVCKKRVRKLLKNERERKGNSGPGNPYTIYNAGGGEFGKPEGRKEGKEGRKGGPFPNPRRERVSVGPSAPFRFRPPPDPVSFRPAPARSGSGPASGPLWFRSGPLRKPDRIRLRGFLFRTPSPAGLLSRAGATRPVPTPRGQSGSVSGPGRGGGVGGRPPSTCRFVTIRGYVPLQFVYWLRYGATGPLCFAGWLRYVPLRPVFGLCG